MNRKKVFGIIGIVLLVLLIIGFGLFNIRYEVNYQSVLKPKYLFDQTYCEVDNECTRSTNNCDGPINIYAPKERSEGSCLEEFCGPKCINNKCQYVQCNYDEVLQ